jgi:hypothetical protein
MIDFWEQIKKFRLAYANRDFKLAKLIISQCKNSNLEDTKGRTELISKIDSILDNLSTQKSISLGGINAYKEKNSLQNECLYSFVTSVFNRFWQLKETLPQNLEVVRNNEYTELVIVDFGGEDSPEIEAFIENNFAFDILSGKLKYYKIKKPWTKFHMAPAKNAAARLSSGEIIVSLDADNMLTQDDFLALSQINYANSIVHQTTGPAPMQHSDWARYKLFDNSILHGEKLTWDGSCGRIACTRKLFNLVNGYNENFVGMGMDDIDFLIRAIKSGASYQHIKLARNTSSIFIDNGSADDDHEHGDNKFNWGLMDKNLSANALKVEYITSVPTDLFKMYEPQCVENSRNSELTLFSSIFNATDYIERFENDLADILATNTKISVWLMDVVVSHDLEISARLRALSNKYDNLFFMPVYKDPGLYECWNIAIKKIQSEYIANLNVDDIRGENWVKSCLSSLKGKVCDVSSPITVPFREKSIKSYSDFFRLDNNFKTTERWFDVVVNYNFENVTTSRESLTAGYYDHTNMFQVADSKKITSYCIPNASTIWRREIHETVGYFNEEEYGAFTDLAFWMEASSQGYLFKQNSHLALFYLSENQAHMRQATNFNTLLKLALKYGSPDYKLLAVTNSFDLSLNEGSYGDHHLLGWNWVRDNIHNVFEHNSDGVILDLFVERTFFWNKNDPDRTYIFKKPWVGFIHTTPHNNAAFDHDGQNLDSLIGEQRFIESLPLCKALIVLSQSNADYLEKKLKALNYNVPIIATFHPNIPIQESTVSHLKSEITEYVYHVGAHLRSFSDFARLPIPKERKVLLIPGNLDADHFINNVVNRELMESGLDEIENYVADMFTASNDDYQSILLNGIIFNSYIEPAGSNLISECISASTSLVINRHPGFEKYLGVDYPLFYDDLNHALDLIEQLKNSNELKQRVEAHHQIRNNELSIKSFNIELINICKKILSNCD